MSQSPPRPNPPSDPSSAAPVPRRAPLGYCTNVHAGANLEQTRANLAQHAVAVRERFSPNEPMGVGIWLSASSAQQLLVDRSELDQFARWLNESGLIPYTFNGFPYGDFHQEVVKHRVYQPTWAQASRRQYTLQLVEILDRLLPQGEEGSISTVPLAWGNPPPSNDFLAAAAAELLATAECLAELENATGRLVYLCLEPEPGCVLQRSGDVVRFFNEYLWGGPLGERAGRYIRVCYDICHHAVMFESPADVMAQYREAGIGIGKMQISSAVRSKLGELSPPQRLQALAALDSFSEARYLHQCVVRGAGQERFFEDLEPALMALGSGEGVDEVRVHFHVPVYLKQFGYLQTTQDHIRQTLQALAPGECQHFEVETYAWEVVPAGLRQPTLAEGIAQELRWFADLAGAACA